MAGMKQPKKGSILNRKTSLNPRFVPGDESTEEEDQKYQCIHCSKTVKAPVFQLKCGHRMCGDCISQHKQREHKVTCPGGLNMCKNLDLTDPKNSWKDNAAMRDLKWKQVPCRNKRAGCPQRLQWSELETHDQECHYNQNTEINLDDEKNTWSEQKGGAKQLVESPVELESYEDETTPYIISSLENGELSLKVTPHHSNTCLLLVGKTGTGKSATGNTILQEKGLFRYDSGSMSVTNSVETHSRKVGSTQLTVVDTPGYGGILPVEEELTGAIENCTTGYDAILLVFRYGTRLTKEELEILDRMKKFFGPHFSQYVILVFTGGDNFVCERQEQNLKLSFKEFLERDKLSNRKCSFGPILREFNQGYILINNFERNQSMKTRQVNELLTLVHMVKERTSGPYTKCMFSEVDHTMNQITVYQNFQMTKKNS